MYSPIQITQIPKHKIRYFYLVLYLQQIIRQDMLETNEYFEGKVKSIAFENNSGKHTIGVIAAGEYEFGTSSNEEMTVINGKLEVWLPNESVSRQFESGENFQIEAGVEFRVKAVESSSYLCRYY